MKGEQILAIDIDLLRRDLENYFGTEAFAGFPMALTELERIQKCSDEELIRTAQKNGFNPEKYENN